MNYKVMLKDNSEYNFNNITEIILPEYSGGLVQFRRKQSDGGHAYISQDLIESMVQR